MKPNVLFATGDTTLKNQVREGIEDVFRLHFTTSTEETRSWIERKPWDAVVVDMKLPNLDGLEVLHMMRHASPASRFITCGSLGSTGELDVLQAGARQLISLPRKPERIIGMLRAVLDPSAPQRIMAVRYQRAENTFFVAFRDGKTYELSRKTIDADDGSQVVRTRVVDDGDAFAVRQSSGNTYDVAWDFVLHHQEPLYSYYKGSPKQQRVDESRAKRIGERVHRARERLGWSLDDLAARTGMQRPNLSRLETGKHLPSLPTLERVADALGIRVAELLALD